jgi:hypothetical protein
MLSVFFIIATNVGVAFCGGLRDAFLSGREKRPSGNEPFKMNFDPP